MTLRSLRLLAVFGLLSGISPVVRAAEPAKPNLIVIFIDDMGYADIGPFGSELSRTPCLDRMAAEYN